MINVDVHQVALTQARSEWNHDVTTNINRGKVIVYTTHQRHSCSGTTCLLWQPAPRSSITANTSFLHKLCT